MRWLKDIIARWKRPLTAREAEERRYVRPGSNRLRSGGYQPRSGGNKPRPRRAAA